MGSLKTLVAASALIAAPLLFTHPAMAGDTDQVTALSQGLRGAGEVFSDKGALAVQGKTAMPDADGVVSGLNTAAAAASAKDAAAAVGGYGDAAARRQVLTQIFESLPIEEIFEVGAEKGMSQVDAVKQLPPAAQEKLIALTREEISVRDPVLMHDLALSNGQDLTMEQLQEILAVARVPMVQQAMLAGATGDHSNMTQPSPADQVVLNRAQNEPFVMAFIQNINLQLAGYDLQAAFTVGAARLAGNM